MNNYKIIDMDNWKRKQHCELFRKSALPQYCICFNLDITNFYKAVKKHGWSFTFAMIYTVSKTADVIENFRYRFLDGNVVIYDKIDTSFAYLDKETELFKFVQVALADNIDDYIKSAKDTAENQQGYFIEPPRNDTYNFPPIPWVAFTNKSHTYGGNPDNAIPMFEWGKFYEENGKLIMPFSVQVHHSFVDGYHIGRFSELIQKRINEIE